MVKEDKPRPKIKFLDLDKFLGNPSMVGVVEGEKEEEDEVEKALKRAAKLKSDRIKMLELDKYLLETEREVKKLREEEERGKGAETTSASSSEVEPVMKALLTDPKTQKQWLDLTEEQRNIILSSIAAVSATGGSAGNLGTVFPLMMMQMRQQPGSSVRDMVELIKTVSPPQAGTTGKDITEAVRLGVELAGGKPEASVTDTVTDIYDKFVKPVLEETRKLREELAQERISRLEKEIEELRSRPGGIEELAQKKEELEALRDIFEGPGARSDEVEKLRLEHDKWKAEREWDMEKWKIEMGLKERSEKEKWKTVKEMLKPAIKRAAPIIDAAVQEGEKRVRGGAPPAAGVAKGEFYTCPKCGFNIDVKGFPDVISCPQCQTQYKKE
jgi:hypothetical protein